MIKKVFCAIGFISVVLSAFMLTALAETHAEKQIMYAAITFDHNNSQTVFQGRMSRKHFQEWFRTDYPVAGERVEIPDEATSFGALVLTDGDEILVMPFYRWGGEKSVQFACHGHDLGRAPKFAVLEQSEKTFVESMKKAIGKIGIAEPNAPANGASPRR